MSCIHNCLKKDWVELNNNNVTSDIRPTNYLVVQEKYVKLAKLS